MNWKLRQLAKDIRQFILQFKIIFYPNCLHTKFYSVSNFYKFSLIDGADEYFCNKCHKHIGCSEDYVSSYKREFWWFGKQEINNRNPESVQEQEN